MLGIELVKRARIAVARTAWILPPVHCHACSAELTRRERVGLSPSRPLHSGSKVSCGHLAELKVYELMLGSGLQVARSRTSSYPFLQGSTEVSWWSSWRAHRGS